MCVLSVNTSFQSQKLILQTQVSEKDDSFTVNNTMLKSLFKSGCQAGGTVRI